MQIENSVAFVTGANRGLGRHFAIQLLERGATKVYAAARTPETVDLPGVVPVKLDLTRPESVAEAAALAADTTLLAVSGVWGTADRARVGPARVS